MQCSVWGEMIFVKIRWMGAGFIAIVSPRIACSAAVRLWWPPSSNIR